MHEVEIRERYGYHSFNDPVLQFRLNRWLYALCCTGTGRASCLIVPWSDCFCRA